MIRMNLSLEDVVNNMIELAGYLSEQADDADFIDLNLKKPNGGSLHLHFEAYVEDERKEK